jgi:ssDNA-binding Zn-finger/Zn-ribbon topoisomerase 1
MSELLAFASKTIESHLCAKCARLMERVRSGKLGFRAFRCPQCSHTEEQRIDTGVIPRSEWPDAAST